MTKKLLGLRYPDAILAKNLFGAIPTEHANCSSASTSWRMRLAITTASPKSRNAPVTSRNASSSESGSTKGV